MDKRVLPNGILLAEAGRMLAEGREVVLKTKGDSMLPAIAGGRDSVALRRRDSLVRGDIVLARIGGTYVLHRIVRIEGDLLTLMGDGNLRCTERCRRADVLGAVTGIVRPDGRTAVPGKARLWMALRPFRRYLLAVWRRWPGRVWF